MSSSKLILLGLVLVFLTGALGHSYLTNPISRTNQRQSNSGCRGSLCLGPCDSKKGASSNTKPVTIARGASISVEWPRNNHAGGFIRIAWTQTSNSDDHASFDAGVQEIFCHEIGGCKPDDPSQPNGGDSGPGDGSRQPCKMVITVPLHLTDGTWTMQWAWFGGAYALGDYYSCVDYTVSGGQAVTAQQAAFFIGGDYTYPGQNKCKFFNTDRLHRCINEPCNNPVFALNYEQSGPAYGVAAQGSSSGNTGSTPSVTTAAKSLTTAAKTVPSSITTGAAKRLTTGIAAPSSITTGSRKPSTTGSKVVTPVTTGVAVPTPSGNGANCVGAPLTPSSSVARVTTVNTWGSTLSVIVEITVVEARLSDWRLQVIWPSEAASTSVKVVYNYGLLLCQSAAPSRHAIFAPVAPWANDQPAGSTILVEIQASNTNMDSQFIQANTQVSVFTA